ncbi:MAG: hypothetical protein GFH27_549291n89 [Chloroflexi bacterium AL-W]|nr:hypothetical protein [Chloroflexi bacterium AL-N1]NOK67444.1 hypothetical protein [Chloroflexi bacterium AL-N10]NOK75064.1 hypothetical protein [Chloroflexi bacterium AL-N5]NOK81851.1 hypothetical protein [Chloroflexi bacterium AL-W]NOK89697.1 hypothetical protein [Chloroflexi bacterium AL-N15]
MTKQKPQHRTVRGQLLLLNNQTQSTDQIKQTIQNTATLSKLPPNTWHTSPNRSFSFNDTQDTFSIDRIEISKQETANKTRTEVEKQVVDLARTLKVSFSQTTLSSQSDPIVTPNWLVGSSPHVDATGGPGGRPVAPDSASLQSGSEVAPWHFTLPPALTKTPPEQRGAGVDVFILDTAPKQTDIDDAYQRWHATNPLLASLLQPGGPLQLHTLPVVEDHLDQDVDYELPDHPYKMPDHGLFVAGIIHTIAPKAILHLVRVLNDYGIGSYESILRGLQFVHQNVSGAKVLVNASLCFDLAQPDAAWLKHWSNFDPFWQGWHPDEIKHMAQPLDRTCQMLHRNGQHIVAAAGNDREGLNSQLPPARFPAACPNVLGVGALRRDNTPASYSNVSDLPRGDGLATFGGHSNATTDMTNATDGMLGVYIGTYPDGGDNTSGWARWAGTSFATPIITGALAVLVADGYSVANATQQLRNSAPGGGKQTVLGEVFPVKQGEPWS